jgi:predicted GNAT family acetyltransferase
VRFIENELLTLDIKAKRQVYYDLLAISRLSGVVKIAPPHGCSLRSPVRIDLDDIVPLEAAYLNEEVFSEPHECSNMARSRVIHILKEEKALIACAPDGGIVGKINTNAQSFSCAQIGGVYVAPEWRNRGIATAMTSAFTRRLLQSGLSATLFVRKDNIPARASYAKAGYEKIADYTISYL